MSIGANNLSRKIAKQLTHYGFDKEAFRNVFNIDGKKYCFSITDKEKAECRQFYDDCDGVLVLNMNNNVIYKFDRETMRKTHAVNRIMPNNKVKASNFIEPYESGIEYAQIRVFNESVTEFIDI